MSSCKHRRAQFLTLPVAFLKGSAGQVALDCCCKADPICICPFDRFGISQDGTTQCEELEVAELIQRPLGLLRDPPER